jgi:hypothetical protein
MVGPGFFPTLSPDGRTLFYSNGIGLLYRAVRSSLTSDFAISTMDAALAHPTSGRSIARFVYFPEGREAYFLHRDLDIAPGIPPDAPRIGNVFRVQVCRGGSCLPDLPAACPIPSPDGLHCYRQVPPASAYPAPGAVCDSGEHLVSLHSAEEASVVRTRWLNSWLGLQGTRWQSGEPYLYEEFTGAEPSSTECADTSWTVRDCITPRNPICERDHWPLYID